MKLKIMNYEFQISNFKFQITLEANYAQLFPDFVPVESLFGFSNRTYLRFEGNKTPWNLWVTDK